MKTTVTMLFLALCASCGSQAATPEPAPTDPAPSGTAAAAREPSPTEQPKQADARPAAADPHANPHADPHANPHGVSTDAPPASSPGMGFMPVYDSDGKGLGIEDVRDGGPAHQAGLRAGDVLTKVGAFSVKDVYDYMAALETLKVGDKVDVVYLRGGESHTAKVTMGLSGR